MARSTSTARFVQGAIAGPDIEQTTVLAIRYFAGDGEAIVAARIGYDADSLNISSVRSSQGHAYLEGDHIEVDYRPLPLVGEAVDTLYIDVNTVRSSGFLQWKVDIFSSLKEEEAHSVRLSLSVEEEPAVSWTLEPSRLFQGEQAQLRIHIDNIDGSGRALKQIEWQWPAGVLVEKGIGWPEGPDGLEAGSSALLSFGVRVGKTLSGQVQIGAKGWVGEMGSVPLSPATLQIDPLPVVELVADTMRVGVAGTITCTWRNTSDVPISIDALRLDVNASFADIALIDAPQGAQLVVEKEHRYLLVEGVGEMAVGATQTIALRATPHRPGPFVWKGSVQPNGRGAFIELPGRLTVEVLWGQKRTRLAATEYLPTDLQLMGRAFALALQQQVDQLPVGREVPLYLEPENKSDANWIVEDALLEIFRKRGYRLLIRPPAEGDRVGVMHYRLVSSRVVYSPGTGGWLLWGASHRREAYGDLMLRLEMHPDAMIRWDKRVRAYLSDEVPRGSADALGGGTMVKREIIEADNKAVERGLSFSIVGGLVYIFFIL